MGITSFLSSFVPSLPVVYAEEKEDKQEESTEPTEPTESNDDGEEGKEGGEDAGAEEEEEEDEPEDVRSLTLEFLICSATLSCVYATLTNASRLSYISFSRVSVKNVNRRANVLH